MAEEGVVEPRSTAEAPVDAFVDTEPEPAIEFVEHAPVMAEEVFEEEPILVEEEGPVGPVRSGLYWIGDTIGSFFSGLFGN